MDPEGARDGGIRIGGGEGFDDDLGFERGGVSGLIILTVHNEIGSPKGTLPGDQLRAVGRS